MEEPDSVRLEELARTVSPREVMLEESLQYLLKHIPSYNYGEKDAIEIINGSVPKQNFIVGRLEQILESRQRAYWIKEGEYILLPTDEEIAEQEAEQEELSSLITDVIQDF